MGSRGVAPCCATSSASAHSTQSRSREPESQTFFVEVRLTDSSTEMQTEDQERSGQRGVPPRTTDPEAPHGAVVDAESSQPAGEERLTCVGSPSVTEGAGGTGGVPSESNLNSGPQQRRMQSLLRQVSSQIRSQASLTSAKTGMLELMQQIKDREAGRTSSLSGTSGADGGSGAGVSEGDGGTQPANGEHGETEPDATAPLEVPSSLGEELEATRATLRGEFELQIFQLRVEMQAYADRAVSDMESRMRNAAAPPHGPAKGRSREQTDGKAVDKKQKPLAAAAATAAAATPALTGRRSRVLTRTMTTIVPKTCAPVIVGPRAKSETLSGCRDCGSLRMRGESDLIRFSHHQGRGCRQTQGRRALPPVIQPVNQALHQPMLPRQRPV